GELAIRFQFPKCLGRDAEHSRRLDRADERMAAEPLGALASEVHLFNAPLLAGFINRPLVFGIPGVLFVWLGIAAIMLFVLRRTAFGFSIYAIGSNERAATLVGLPVSLIRTLLYGLSGLFAGLTGVCVIGYTGTSFISVGDQYVLPSIIAVVIGGTSLAGGAGGYIGTMAGAVALTILQSVLITLNLDVWARQIIFGVTLLALMLLYGRQKQLRV
ncbi:MAG: ABC transporter permease, partial [Rhizobium oryzihabitans]